MGQDFVIEDDQLKKYSGPGGFVEIPKGVTSIRYNAFYHCSSLIPEKDTVMERIMDTTHYDRQFG